VCSLNGVQALPHTSFTPTSIGCSKNDRLDDSLEHPDSIG